MQWKPPRLALLAVVAVALAGSGQPRMLTHRHGTDPKAVMKTRAHEAFRNLPLYFIENRGQVHARVAYYVQGRNTSVYFTPGGVTIALTGPAASQPADGHRGVARPVSFRTSADSEDARQRWAVKLDFVGANPDVRPRGQEPTPAVISYFKGSREQWKAGLGTYASLVYRDLWPGIDLVFTGTINRLKYTFLIHPGADPERIKLAYRGATAVTLTGGGELDVSTPVGGFRDERPYAYQEVEGRRVEVTSAYALDREAAIGVQGYGFRLGSYDRAKALVLDPAMLVYAGYIGGTGEDVSLGIAVDSAGNAYVAGWTTSSEATFPVNGGPDLTFNAGGEDAFVAKVNPAGTALVYAGYIGGADRDVGRGIAIDSGGNAYVTGWTFSSEATFPVTVGPDLTFNGGQDAFVAKVNALGTGLDYAGYVGGASNDEPRSGGIAVDSDGSAYVTGITFSSEATFPVTVGPDLTYNGGGDGFVARVNTLGTGFLYAGYIGGSAHDFVEDTAVDTAGNAYVTGVTFSSEATFPVAVGPDLTFNGGEDAFVAKVNALGTGLVYAGYIGGSDVDQGIGIALDSASNAYVTGLTRSSEATFPATVGPDLTFNGGAGDGFVARVNALGTGLDYGGYIGGADFDTGRGMAVDSAGNAYVAGATLSSEATFPVTGGPDLTYNGGGDAFVAEVNSLGTALLYAGYIGGADFEAGYGIAVDSVGSAYVIGQTSSSEASFPVTGGPDLTFNGGPSDAFVAKIGNIAAPGSADLSLVKTDAPDPVAVGQDLTYTLSVTNNGPDPATGVVVNDSLPSSVAFVSASPDCTYIQPTHTVMCSLTLLAAGSTAVVDIEVRPTQGGTITNTANVTANEADADTSNNADTESTRVHGPPNPPEPPACDKIDLPPQAHKPPVCP
jgi:uncharacterized repeat protein (TIGR01451 family)